MDTPVIFFIDQIISPQVCADKTGEDADHCLPINRDYRCYGWKRPSSLDVWRGNV